MKLPILKQDKANHVLYGAACWIVVAGLLSAFSSATAAQFFGFLAALALGVGKELLDHYQNSALIAEGRPAEAVPDPWDAVATAAGGAGMWLGAVITQGW